VTAATTQTWLLAPFVEAGWVVLDEAGAVRELRIPRSVRQALTDWPLPQRRVEARVGELLGEPVEGRPRKTSVTTDVSIDRQARVEFRKLAQAVQLGALRYEDDG
jgi:hypothetical protein